MRKILISIFLLITPILFIKAQSDTLYMNHEKVACSIKEVDQDAVKFVYPGEDILNSVYKNSIQKIVFKSGRTQIFSEASSFKKIDSATDYEKVTITGLASEVSGLYKITEVGAKAKGTTIYSSQERVKERAYKKMKIQAALYGANVVYLLNQREEGNKIGGQFGASSTAETNLTGVAYSNEVIDQEQFKKRIGDKKEFKVKTLCKLSPSDGDLKRKELNGIFILQELQIDNGTAYLVGKFQDEDEVAPNNLRVQLVTLGTHDFAVAYRKGSTVYNMKVELD